MAGFRSSLRLGLLIGLLLLGLPSTTWAGSICGTVRDASTSLGIPNAGIFVRTPAGAYTGFYGATNASGSFCINSVPIGTYDLEVRVNDYQVGYVRGVVVTTTTDVTIPATLGPVALAPPSPNPARVAARLPIVLAQRAAARLLVLDARGRLVRGWNDPALEAGSHDVDWNLRDQEGRRVSPGLYFVHLEAGGHRRVRPLVVLN
jgi:hypothetical protein